MNENYINLLAEILDQTDLNQVKLAQALRVTHATLNRWLKGKAIPQPARMGQIYVLYKELVGIKPLSLEVVNKLLEEAKSYEIEHISQIVNQNRPLREDLLLEFTYNSNTIEGGTFSKKETDTIIFSKQIIGAHSLEEHLAVTNHTQALQDIFNRKYQDISEDTILQLHKTLMQGIREDAGEYAKTRRGIRGVNLALPHPDDIKEEMENLISHLNNPLAGQNPLEHVAVIHSDFEAIHPFGDGNGRVGRLIMAIQLLSLNYPPALIETKRKADYYEALEFAQKNSPTHLLQFIIKEIKYSYQIFQKYL